MHNWIEVSLVARERIADRLQQSEGLRRAQSARESLRRIESGRAPARATLVLSRGELVSVQVRRRPYRVTCVAGRLWVTAEGSTRDHALTAGESATFFTRGRLVIEALRTATVRLDCRGPARLSLGSPLRAATAAC